MFSYAYRLLKLKTFCIPVPHGVADSIHEAPSDALQWSVFFDTTYKTSGWAILLFVLTVRTNCGYQPVAIFICGDKTSTSIYEAV